MASHGKLRSSRGGGGTRHVSDMLNDSGRNSCRVVTGRELLIRPRERGAQATREW